mmetsp:Transcript_118695/g.206704  ORF Transcript_118695/g.206704 Transcript_118695/m.206704 type:complete len:116 (+) Transcript_118695:987-1334(+)
MPLEWRQPGGNQVPFDVALSEFPALQGVLRVRPPGLHQPAVSWVHLTAAAGDVTSLCCMIPSAQGNSCAPCVVCTGHKDLMKGDDPWRLCVCEIKTQLTKFVLSHGGPEPPLLFL